MSESIATERNSSSAPLTAPRALAGLALLVGALWLGWKAWDVNVTLSCWKYEWPQLDACKDIMGRTPEEQVTKLQERLAANPGDSTALINLLIWAHLPGGMPSLDGPALLEAAAQKAPQNANVLRLQASYALQKAQWSQALDPLIRLSRFHFDAGASQAIAALIGQSGNDEKLMAALLAATKRDGAWLDGPLRYTAQAKATMASALPLITELMDSQQLTPALGQFVIGRLKGEGLWMEAHAVWRHLWRRPLDLVFNGDFEQNFVRGGFDWEAADANDHRSGARIELVGRSNKGQVLKVQFTGKSMASPILRQDLLLLPGAYTLRGSMQSTDLRSEKGLAWVVTCAKDGRELGRTTALKPIGRDWTNWEAKITMPADCTSFGARLALLPFAPYEATTGMRGDAYFDALSLEKDKGTP